MGFADDWRARDENSVEPQKNLTGGGQEKYQGLQRGFSQAAGPRPQIKGRLSPPSHAAGLRRIVLQNRPLGSTTDNRDYRPQHKSRVSTWDPLHPVIQYNTRKDVLKKHQYTRGLIFNAPVHTEDANPTRPTANEEARSISAHSIVFTKPRYLIVVSLHEITYMAIPLFTYEHKGLLGREHCEHEHVSVRDGRLPALGLKAQSRYKPIVTDGTGPRIKELSTVHFANPVSRNYDLPISVCGRLTDGSADQLLKLFNDELYKGLGFDKHNK